MPGELEKQIDIVARIIFGEAGSEGDDLPSREESLRAVASVMYNRSLISGQSVYDEATKPNQFTVYWQPENWKNIDANIKLSPKTWAMSQRMAKEAIDGIIKDNTQRATYYNNPKDSTSTFFNDKTPYLTIGNHVFYKDIDPYLDSKLQKKTQQLKQPVQEQAQPRADIVPGAVQGGAQQPITQPRPKVIIGKETPEEAAQKEFAMKATERLGGGKGSERFQKVFKAWVDVLTPDQLKIVKDYLPEQFLGEQQVNPSPYNKNFDYNENQVNKEDMKIGVINQYPFSPEAQESAINIKTKYPSDAELALQSGALSAGQIAGGTYYGGRAWLEELVDKLSPNIYDKLPEWMRITLDNIKTGERINLKNPDPFTFTHELMHGLWGKMMPIGKGETTEEAGERIVPFIERFNQKWEEAKKQDKTLQRIDKDIEDNYNKDYLNSGELANERFAFLGSYVGPVGREAVPSQLRAYYANVFSLKKPLKHSIEYGDYLDRQPKGAIQTGQPRLQQTTPYPTIQQPQPIGKTENKTSNPFQIGKSLNPFEGGSINQQPLVPFKEF